MKTPVFIFILICVCFLSVPVFGQTDTTVVIQSKAFFECNRERLPSPFRVVLSDGKVTVNGCEVTSLERLAAKKMTVPKPSPETVDFINWLANEVSNRTKEMIAAKKEQKAIRQTMKEFLTDQVKGNQHVSLRIEGEDLYLRHSSWPKGRDVFIPVPEVLPQPVDQAQVLRQLFDEICIDLRGENLVVIKAGVIKVKSLSALSK